MLRVIVSLAVVIGLMAIAARILQRRGKGFGSRRSRDRAALEVVAQQSLGRHGAIAVVRVADQHIMVGSTEQSIQFLSEVRGEMFAAEASTTAATGDEVSSPTCSPRTRSRYARGTRRGGSARMTLLQELRELTVRRT